MISQKDYRIPVLSHFSFSLRHSVHGSVIRSQRQISVTVVIAPKRRVPCMPAWTACFVTYLHNSDAVSVFFSWTYLCLYLYSHRAREIFGYPRLPDEPWEKTLIWEDDD